MKTLLALILVLAATTAFVACGDDDDDDGNGNESSPTPVDSTGASPTEAGSPTETPEPTAQGDACPPNPDPATPDEVAIASPRPGETVMSPFDVTGVGAAFEAVIQVTLLDADGNELFDEAGMTNAGQTLAPFLEEVEFEVDAETAGCLQVYTLSAQDSTPTNIAQIPLILAP